MGFSCEKFYSHPDTFLRDHLESVGKGCRRCLIDAGVRDEKLIRTGELVGKGHDFGKYTRFFQEYLRGKKFNREQRFHSPLSALFSAWLVNKEIEDPFLVTASFLCVLKHHGNLDLSLDDLPSIFEELTDDFRRNNNYIEQINSVEERLNIVSREMGELGVSGIDDFLEEVKCGRLSEIFHKIMDLKYSKVSPEERWRRFFSILSLFSCLIDHDKMKAAGLKVEERPLSLLMGEVVDRYCKSEFSKPKCRMDGLRCEIRENVMNSVSEILRGKEIPRIMTITAPTGTGKTLTGLSVALKLREEIERRRGIIPRIIYSLPFINIIEQNYSVFEKVLKKVNGLSEVPLSLLLKHHHLYFPKEKEDLPLEDALMLVESWESEIIVTTFVQLFHTLIGTENHMLKKYHNIANSIIILDEVQSIPIEYWKLTRELFKKLTKLFNCYVIFMTATQPIIFYDVHELVSNHKGYYRGLDRVQFHYLEEDMDVKSAVKLFLEKFFKKTERLKEKKSALIVLNTISSSILAYDEVKKSLGDRVIGLKNEGDGERLKDGNKIVLAYLSTNIIPKERKRRIELINKLMKQGRRVIVVSTQVVEAGVDLDFDMVMRDIGPFDSINQVAGRCNRNWEKPMGEIYIVRLIDEAGKSYSTTIYGSLLIKGVTEDLLRGVTEFEEKDILNITKKYFERAYEVMNAEESGKSNKILDSIKKLNFPKVSKFSLIKEEPKISVFIEIDNKAKNILESFRKMLDDLKKKRRAGDLKEVFKCRSRLREVRTKLEEYIVNVWKQNEPPDEVIESGTDIRYARRSEVGSEVEKFYDEEVGYKRKAIHPASS